MEDLVRSTPRVRVSALARAVDMVDTVDTATDTDTAAASADTATDTALMSETDTEMSDTVVALAALDWAEFEVDLVTLVHMVDKDMAIKCISRYYRALYYVCSCQTR